MLGKHVGSMKGQTEVKAIPSEYGMPKLETTGAGEGTLLGHPVQFMATYQAEMQPDGSFYGARKRPETAARDASMRAGGVAAPLMW